MLAPSLAAPAFSAAHGSSSCGDHCSFPAWLSSCLPLEHNVALDLLKLAGKSCAINPLGKAKKTPQKRSRLKITFFFLIFFFLVWRASVVLGAKADGGSWMQEELLGLKEAPAWFPELPRLRNELFAGGFGDEMNLLQVAW